MKEVLAQKTILIVDDEDKVRESVREVLGDEGYRVVDTADGTRVMNLIEQEKPELVLLDIWMPQIDGIDLLKQIKSQQPTVNVVMISGHGNIHTAVEATKSGAFDFLEKPLSLDALLLTAQRALGHYSPSRSRELHGRSRKAKAGKRSPTVAKHETSRPTLKQRTLKKSVVTSGQGLHSGMKTPRSACSVWNRTAAPLCVLP